MVYLGRQGSSVSHANGTRDYLLFGLTKVGLDKPNEYASVHQTCALKTRLFTARTTVSERVLDYGEFRQAMIDFRYCLSSAWET